MKITNYFSKLKISGILLIVILVGLISLRLLKNKDVNEHVGNYLTYVVKSDSDISHPQIWFLKFSGKTGTLQRHQKVCGGQLNNIGTETIIVNEYVANESKVRNGLANLIDSEENYKFSVDFQIPSEDNLACTLVYISKQELPLITCYKHSNVSKYLSSKIDDKCAAEIKKIDY